MRESIKQARALHGEHLKKIAAFEAQIKALDADIQATNTFLAAQLTSRSERHFDGSIEGRIAQRQYNRDQEDKRLAGLELVAELESEIEKLHALAQEERNAANRVVQGCRKRLFDALFDEYRPMLRVLRAFDDTAYPLFSGGYQTEQIGFLSDDEVKQIEKKEQFPQWL
jgi:hypothetical protein